LAQRSIEILIGRLVTDEAFRSAYRGDTMKTLTGFVEAGYELTAVEIAAVQATAPDVWEHVAEQIDPRIQKVSFTCEERSGAKGTPRATSRGSGQRPD
jgi:hypothetical protein